MTFFERMTAALQEAREYFEGEDTGASVTVVETED